MSSEVYHFLRTRKHHHHQLWTECSTNTRIVSALETEKFFLIRPKYWFPVQLLCSITPHTRPAHLRCSLPLYFYTKNFQFTMFNRLYSH